MSESEGRKSAWLPATICGVALALFAASLALPALRVQGRGEWIAGDPGFQCVFLSLAEFPSCVPNALVILMPLIALLAGKPVQKAFGVVFGITTLTVLDVSIPGLALTGFRQGMLPGYWLWVAALITATAGLLLGGFSPVPTSQHGPGSAGDPQRSRTRPRGAPLLCWLAFAILVVTRLVRLGGSMGGSFPQGLSRGISAVVLDLVGLPALLAMAPLACLYADVRTRRSMALALGVLGLLPFLSVDGPDGQPFGALAPLRVQRTQPPPGAPLPVEQPFEVLAPLLLSYLTVALAAAGLLVSAGSMSRRRSARAKHADPGRTEPPDQQVSTPEVSGAVAPGNPPLGAALCWLALVHALGLGSLPFHLGWIGQWTSMPLWGMMFKHFMLTCSLLAMAPWVCTFSGPWARRVLGAILAVIALMMFRGIWWIKPEIRPDVIALGLSAAGLFLADVAARQRAE